MCKRGNDMRYLDQIREEFCELFRHLGFILRAINILK